MGSIQHGGLILGIMHDQVDQGLSTNSGTFTAGLSSGRFSIKIFNVPANNIDIIFGPTWKVCAFTPGQKVRFCYTKVLLQANCLKTKVLLFYYCP